MPGTRDESAAATRSKRPLFRRPRRNAITASITVEIILILFADCLLKLAIFNLFARIKETDTAANAGYWNRRADPSFKT